jgi:hypothetical protein
MGAAQSSASLLSGSEFAFTPGLRADTLLPVPNSDPYRRKLDIALAATVVLLALLAGSAFGQLGEHPSVHDTVAGVIKRMKQQLSTNELNSLPPQKVESFLTPKERQILANEHIRFRVNEFGIMNVPAFQVLDIQISGNRLVYCAYDIEGKASDDLVIEK